jgi:hypothetical protein
MCLYKAAVMHKLADRDKEQRQHFATWVRHKEGILHNMWFTDKTYFYLDAVVNK